MGVVAAEENGGQLQQWRGVRPLRLLAFKAHFTLGTVALAGDLVASAIDIERPRRHFADG